MNPHPPEDPPLGGSGVENCWPEKKKQTPTEGDESMEDRSAKFGSEAEDPAGKIRTSRRTNSDSAANQRHHDKTIHSHAPSPCPPVWSLKKALQYSLSC